ncbi:PREDICTED: extensin-3-like [Polistes canadensis]|uniref:extensin-3-like n=1 Tax=Polistes canadensis TaxID=91411 RepID=UPI000718BEF3|nr:PREDICTED: extensin-3-like [Polistes canadensis]KAI4483238.1 hypothetical protein M0804_008293 [Polistes exclamans]
MLRLLIPCLLWLASVRSHGVEHMDTEMMNSGTIDSSMTKLKRHFVQPPCPPQYHVPSYHQSSYFIKSYEQPSYPKKEVTVHQPPLQSHYTLSHQPSYSIIPKQHVTYVKPQVVSYQPVHAPSYPVHPVQSVVKPWMPEYTPPKVIYQKPSYTYAPIYQKPMYEMPKIYVKKFEVPAVQTQVVYQKPGIVYQKPAVVYQKPHPITYVPPPPPPAKVIHLQAAPISYVKIAQPPPMIHPPVYLPPAPVHHAPAIVKIAKPMCD